MEDGAPRRGTAAALRRAAAAALKNKLQILAGQHSAVLESLPPTVRKCVDALTEIQTKHDEIEANFFKERAELEAKYQKMYEPLYIRRFDIVNNGLVEVDKEADKTQQK
ncbi:hypothetical protein MKW98_026760 [Papaver atlanticum]|uniref:Uncharacterized protein n=1 Tax=Papaver atlanticum TaxID=357466 RepID=A0AAD4RZW0_9MAGN|nr:hypothetical protein MKW98_026760 [Papaver atlanticum]